MAAEREQLPGWLRGAILWQEGRRLMTSTPATEFPTCTELHLKEANFLRRRRPSEADWAAFPMLEKVVFGSARRGGGAEGVTGAMIHSLLKSCPRLSTIFLNGANLDTNYHLLPASLPHSYPALKVVDLEGAKGVTLEGITTLLQSCPNLSQLVLLKVRPRLDGVVEADCPNLEIKGGNILLLPPTKGKKQPKSAAKVPTKNATSNAAAAAAAAAPAVPPPPPPPLPSAAATTTVAVQHPKIPKTRLQKMRELTAATSSVSQI